MAFAGPYCSTRRGLGQYDLYGEEVSEDVLRKGQMLLNLRGTAHKKDFAAPGLAEGCI